MLKVVLSIRRSWVGLIKESRKKDKEFIQEVEEKALERIRETLDVKEKAAPATNRCQSVQEVEDVVDEENYDDF